MSSRLTLTCSIGGGGILVHSAGEFINMKPEIMLLCMNVNISYIDNLAGHIDLI